MLAVMAQQDDEAARLQCNIRHGTRRRLKAAAVEHEVDMGDIADALLAHMLPLLAAGKAPPQVTAAIEKAARERAKERAKGDGSGS